MKDFIKKNLDRVELLAGKINIFELSEFQLAPEDKHQERLKICSSCEFFELPLKVCGKCGCSMVDKVKVATASCPINKWDKVVAIDGTPPPSIPLLPPIQYYIK